MKLAKLFKPETPFAEYRQRLRAAVESGKVTEETDASAALGNVFGSLEVVELVMILEEQGEGDDLSARNVRGLLWRLDRLDREYEREHRK